MVANTTSIENELVESALSWLRDKLPDAWKVGPRNGDDETRTIQIEGGNSYATLVVEAKSSFTPRSVDEILGSVGRRLRDLNPGVRILVVAPWLSPRTRDRLVEQEMNYIDLTGNARIRVDHPALYIETQGATRDPSPSPRGGARLRGPKAGRLIRTLLDVQPPYGVRELAEATGLALGYVSHLLETLNADALVERSRRGRVEAVEIAGLVRRWVESYSVFRSNDASTFLAPPGITATFRLLGAPALTAVTGSFAARRIAPVAAPGMLFVYCDDTASVAEMLNLLPADTGANVCLLRPFDRVVWSRTVTDEGLRYVAPSQVAADCLTGNGRMPAEGEAVLEWMLANESSWRASSLEG